MKKNYMIPQMECHHYQVEGMIAAISSIGGNTGIRLADPEEDIPTDGDVKGNPFGESIFD